MSFVHIMHVYLESAECVLSYSECFSKQNIPEGKRRYNNRQATNVISMTYTCHPFLFVVSGAADAAHFILGLLHSLNLSPPHCLSCIINPVCQYTSEGRLFPNAPATKEA